MMVQWPAILPASSLLHSSGSSEGSGSSPASASSSPSGWRGLGLGQEDGQEYQSYEQADTQLHLELFFLGFLGEI